MAYSDDEGAFSKLLQDMEDISLPQVLPQVVEIEGSQGPTMGSSSTDPAVLPMDDVSVTEGCENAPSPTTFFAARVKLAQESIASVVAGKFLSAFLSGVTPAQAVLGLCEFSRLGSFVGDSLHISDAELLRTAGLLRVDYH
jgi:hypothetical protein